MKKIALLISCIAMLFASATLHADNISERQARNIAATQMASLKGEKVVDYNAVSLVKTYTNPATGDATLYIFNMGDEGYVVISGSNSSRPVLAHSENGAIEAASIDDNPYLAAWLQGYADMIAEAQMQNIPASKRYAAEWGQLEEGQPLMGLATKSTNTKNLLATTWSQSAPYNNKCPIYSGGAHSVVGCVALSMGMVIRYWEYPKTGTGVESQSVSGMPYTVNYSEAYYDYSKMPNYLQNNSPADQIEATATFLFHCGMAVRSSYSSNATGSSLEYVGKALNENFKYPKRITDGAGNVTQEGFYQVERKNMSNDAWIELLRNEILSGRPIIYRAADNGNSGDHAGHAFNIDGYKPETGEFHVNWGWGSTGTAAPMWCDLNEVDGLSTTIGSTYYLYSAGQGAIINIMPPADSITIDLPNVAKQSTPTNQNSYTETTIHAYPSPATDIINVNYTLATDYADIELYNIYGVKMDSKRIESSNNFVSFNVKNLARGVYTLRIGDVITAITLR